MGFMLKPLRGAPRRDRKIRGPTPPARLVLCNHWENLHVTIAELLKQDVVRGDGGYLIELERRGYVDSGSRREKVGTGKGSGQFTPEVAINHPHALRELHEEFLNSGSEVLQALTFFGTREKLVRAGYGAETEHINHAAVKLAKESECDWLSQGILPEVLDCSRPIGLIAMDRNDGRVRARSERLLGSSDTLARP